MKKHILILCTLILLLMGCTYTSDLPDSDNSATIIPDETVPVHAYQVDDLGICSAENTFLPENARNPWDIVVVDGRLYVGSGDYGNNTGPTSIWVYEDKTGKWISSSTVDQEAIARFVNLDGQIVALGVDPIGNPQYAPSYVLKDGAWETYSQIEGALHIFDAEIFSGSIYYGLGSEGESPAILKYDIDTGKYTNIPLYKNGIDYVSAVTKTELLEYRRVYDLFLVNDKLFCSFTCLYTNNKLTLEFFELKEDKFEFCQAYISSNLKMYNKVVKNQVMLNSDAIYGGSCYLSVGNLYKTDDFIQFEQISIPDDACVTDLYAEKTKGQEHLYILATIKDGEEYKNIVYTLSSGELTEVHSFKSSVSALSFAKDGDTFYIGLGGADSTSADTGRVLRFIKNNQ